MEDKLNIGRVITFAGAVLAFLIGSGFASGQEILQYFAAYQYEMILVGLTIIPIMAFANYCFVIAGNSEKFDKGSQVFRFYCGPLVGTAFDYFAAIFCYMSFIVMLGGIGATVQQQFGISSGTGAVVMACLACGTVIFGLNTIVDIIGKIGPFIAILSLLIGLGALFSTMGQIPQGAELIKSGQVEVMKASTNWFFAGCSYGGFCLIWLAGFMAKLGAGNRMRELQLGQMIGVVTLIVACVVVGFAQVANIQSVAGTQVPNLILAKTLAPSLAHGFAVIIVLAIYTTACPLLWTVSVRFSNEGSGKFRLLTVILGVIGCFVALKVPFNTLVNYIYVLNGYGGAVLFLLMVFKVVRIKLGLAKSAA